MHNKQHMCKIMAIGLFVMLVLAAAIPVLAAKLPVSKTAEQEVLEEKKDLEEAVTADESVPVPLEVAVENLPEDTTPRYSLSQIIFSGNTLFSDEQLLSNVPDLFNASRVAVVEPDNLYDLRPVKAIVAEPNAIQEVSARTIQGFTQYILSIYQKKHYAGIYVYLPGEALEADGDLAQGILPVRILEAPVSELSSAYYDVNNVSVDDPNSYYLKESALKGWSPVQEGEVINRKKLDDYINLLNLNPDRYVAAVVSKGDEPDSLAVNYNVYEANPWHFFVQIDNSGTDDIQWRPKFGLINTNLLGYDDKFTAIYQTTPDSTMLDEYAIYGSYDFPILGPKLRLNLYAGYNEFDIADPDINFLGSGTFTGGILRYNAMQHDNWFVDVTGTLGYEESKIRPDIALPGLDSDIHMTLWGAGTELYKTTDMKDTFFGFNMVGLLDSSDEAKMDASRGPGGASDDFHIFYLNGRHSRYLDPDKIQRLSASVRYTVPDERLVPAKMTSFGGMYTIRGYDEYEIVADGGLITSLQYEYDLARKQQVELFGQEESEQTQKPFIKKLAPLLFVDYGQARIKDATPAEDTDQELASWGGGIILELGDNFTGTVYYGYPLIATDNTRSGKGRVHTGFLLRW
ncbi:MAG: ShlB/FhaC/HecB family hemolysin secretion/activation protein [Planctomycetota bacterium]